LFALCISIYSQAQQEGEQKWTDKNNAGQYGAYMIKIAYYERGYMGASVKGRDDGALRIFQVDPGRIYHIKAVQILGQNDLPAEATSAAPTVGDVYSAARINEWIATLKSQYKKGASWGMRADRANADVTVEVRVAGDAMPDPK
jgi:outer membrane protein assembly factor BamA